MPCVIWNKLMNVKILCKLTSWLCLWCSRDQGYSALSLWEEFFCLLSFLLISWWGRWLWASGKGEAVGPRQSVSQPSASPGMLWGQAMWFCFLGGGPLRGVNGGSEWFPQRDPDPHLIAPGQGFSHGQVTATQSGKTAAPPLEFLAPIFAAFAQISYIWVLILQSSASVSHPKLLPHCPRYLIPCILLPPPFPGKFSLLKDLGARYHFYPWWFLCSIGHYHPISSWLLWHFTFLVLLMTLQDHFPSHPQVSSPCCLFSPLVPILCADDCWMWFSVLTAGSTPHISSHTGQLHSNAPLASLIQHVIGFAKHILFHLCWSTQAGNLGDFLLLPINPLSHQFHLVNRFLCICNKIQGLAWLSKLSEICSHPNFSMWP